MKISLAVFPFCPGESRRCRFQSQVWWEDFWVSGKRSGGKKWILCWGFYLSLRQITMTGSSLGFFFSFFLEAGDDVFEIRCIKPTDLKQADIDLIHWSSQEAGDHGATVIIGNDKFFLMFSSKSSGPVKWSFQLRAHLPGLWFIKLESGCITDINHCKRWISRSWSSFLFGFVFNERFHEFYHGCQEENTNLFFRCFINDNISFPGPLNKRERL